MRRSYDQYCPLARALDLVGERWTLLIVRDLLGGPLRYTDLHRGLPGLATDLLTERLRRLEEAGVVRRRELPPPASATVYELTERGRDLEPGIYALARFGLGLLTTPPSAEDPPPPGRFAILLQAMFDPAGAPADPETWVFDSGAAQVAVTVGAETFEVHMDPEDLPHSPAMRLIADVPTIYGVVTGKLDAQAARADGRLRIEGDAESLNRMRATFPVARAQRAPVISV